jgi:hypothetical protein
MGGTRSCDKVKSSFAGPKYNLTSMRYYAAAGGEPYGRSLYLIFRIRFVFAEGRSRDTSGRALFNFRLSDDQAKASEQKKCVAKLIRPQSQIQ